jgi:hypothetical protein
VPVREQWLVYDNVPMTYEWTLVDCHVSRVSVLLMKPGGFDGPKDMFYIFVHLLKGKTVLLNKVELSDTAEKVKMVTKKMENTPSSQEMISQFNNQRMDYEMTCGATLLEVLEHVIPDPVAVAQMSAPTDRFEAAFAQARNPNRTPMTLPFTQVILTSPPTLSSSPYHPITLSP